jgi:YHS domain-containing protein
MDSLRKEMGQPPTYEATESVNDDEETTKKSKSKKKKKKIHEPMPESDEFNPMEQVAQAILRRKQALDAPPSSLLGVTNTIADAAALGALELASYITPQSLEPELIAAGWESAKDPNSGKTYYFRRSTNERSWKKPDLPKRPDQESNGEQLPDGWKSAKDQSSGKEYYYHTSGETSWKKPLRLID